MPHNRFPWLAAPLVLSASAAAAQLWNPLSTVPKPASSTKKPAITIKCLHPGATKPVPCSSATAGTTVQIDAATSVPLNIVVRPAQATRKPITGPTTITPKPLPNRSGSYVLTMPRHWCAGNEGVQFKIQFTTSDMQQSESGGDRDSLGYFQMRC